MHTLFLRRKPAAPQRTGQHFSCESTRHTLGLRSGPTFHPTLFPFLQHIWPKAEWANLGPAPGAPFLSLDQRGCSKVQPLAPNTATTSGSGVRGSPSKGQLSFRAVDMAGGDARSTLHSTRHHRRPVGSHGPHQKWAVPSQAGQVAPPVAFLRRDTHRVVQLRFLAVHRVPHVATEEERRAPEHSLGSGASPRSPYFTAIPGSPRPRALLRAPRAQC